MAKLKTRKSPKKAPSDHHQQQPKLVEHQQIQTSCAQKSNSRKIASRRSESFHTVQPHRITKLKLPSWSKKNRLSCAGITKNGSYCKNNISKPNDGLPLCHHHTDQRYTHTECSGIDPTTNMRCEARVARGPNSYGLCETHADQIPLVPNFFEDGVVPVEIIDLVVEELEPYDRIALALANRACLNRVKDWSNNRKIIPVASSHNPTLYICDMLTERSRITDHETTFYQASPGSRAYVATSNNTFFTPPSSPAKTRKLYTAMGVARKHKVDCGSFVSRLSESRLQSVMMERPHLFAVDPDKPGNCMLGCGPLVSSLDDLSIDESLAIYDCRNYDDTTVDLMFPAPKLDLKLRYRYFCVRCASKRDIVMRMPWCYECDGKLTPTIIARVFWKVVGVPNMPSIISLEDSEPDDDDEAGLEDDTDVE